MKKILLLLNILLFTAQISFTQERAIARGATPGELYLTDNWYTVFKYHIYADTVRKAIYRATEYGKKLTIQYDADVWHEPLDSLLFEMNYIIADATPGVLYNVRRHDSFALWVSFDYGKKWIFREENIGGMSYAVANVEGIVYRGNYGEVSKSIDYGSNFSIMENISQTGKEAGLADCEFFYIMIKGFQYTNDCYLTYLIEKTIDEEFVCCQIWGRIPDVYRGGLPGEVYVSSMFPEENNKVTYKVSFSADTGRTFRHVYVSEQFGSQSTIPVFMSDREPGVFYIVKRYFINEYNLEYLRLCIEYYRDYGETLEAVFCHDLTKNYVYEEVPCENTTHLKADINQNTIQLQWTTSVDNSCISGYHVYRNNTRITNQLLTELTYIDNITYSGNYDYYVRTYFKEGCVSDSSNHVTIEIVCEPINDLVSEKLNANIVLLTWGEPESSLQIEGYTVFRNSLLQNSVLLTDTAYLDENVPEGNYEYYVVAHYANGCVSVTSNHVMESVGLGVKGVKELEGVKVWPNPAFTTVTIEANNFNKVEVYNVFGQLLNISMEKIVDISTLNSGVYFLKIYTEKGMIVKKVIKN